MNLRKPWAHAATGWIVLFLAGAAQSQMGSRARLQAPPEAEFHFARMIYRTFGGGGSHGYFQPWWAIDYPLAEEHFLPALRRFTNMSVADDSRHLDVTETAFSSIRSY